MFPSSYDIRRSALTFRVLSLYLELLTLFRDFLGIFGKV